MALLGPEEKDEAKRHLLQGRVEQIGRIGRRLRGTAELTRGDMIAAQNSTGRVRNQPAVKGRGMSHFQYSAIVFHSL